MTNPEVIKTLDTIYERLEEDLYRAMTILKSPKDVTDSIRNEMVALSQAKRAVQLLEDNKPQEHCDNCKEYDKTRNFCPRWSTVIREALHEIKKV